MNRALALCTLFSTLCGCGEALDDFCFDARLHACELGVRCGYFESAKGCAGLALYDEWPGMKCEANVAAVKGNWRRYDAAAAARCLEASKTSCDPMVLACPEAFIGTASAGGLCFTDGDCAEGTFCFNSDRCPGTCSPTRHDGELLVDGARCDHGLVANTEVLDHGDGGSTTVTVCRSMNPGDTCQGDCGPGLFCDFELHRCVLPKAVGAECIGFNYECELPLTCVNNVCARYSTHGATTPPCQLDLRFSYDLQRCVALADESTIESLVCTQNIECQQPLVCIGSRCLQPFSDGARCRVEQPECSRGSACVRDDSMEPPYNQRCAPRRLQSCDP